MVPLVIEERSAHTRQKVILLVEEDFLTRWGAAQYLRETGFFVLEAVSAGEALAIARSGQAIDAVYCDAGAFMGVDGYAFLQCLEVQFPDLPVLFISQGTDPSGPLMPKATRVKIAKPYAMCDVEQCLHALIAKRS